ncbi:S1C family serine protease [Streptomyces djakartensis]|uniref:Protease n=1 Tax=Streptomyces djakartensis TaxID=68193 RepID=A0ABQ2Z2S3_9ACTN|nr:trypsin-like peptidase domain-containing protein [Streptomyces djakartensis]GGY00809.1 protease [Streptomyces djakartensis]
MDEGKPTKATWWSRPRSQDPSGAPEGTGADEVRGQGVSPAGSPGPDGDFELARPAVRQDDAGDYELRRPDAVVAGDGTDVEDSVPAASATPSEGAPTPLHDPDPYSTPPYGQPGPWAPAPPVQHPAVTPAQGAQGGAIPGQPAPPGTPVPAAHGGTPPVPSSEAPTPTAHTSAAEAPGVPAQAPASAPGVAGQAPASAPGVPGQALAPGASAQAPMAQAPGVPGQALAPGASAQAPMAQAPGVPAQAPAVPGQAPAVGVPAPAPGQALAAGAAAAAPVPGPDPWRRYDPWAAPVVPGGAGPLQQNGAGVLSTEQRRRRGRKALVGGAVLLALLSGGIGGVAGTYLERNGGVGTIELPQAGKEAAGRDADSVAGIAGRALPSVVTLHVSGSGEQGTGTGFVLDTRGHILTNNHVVRPAGSAGEITVTFNGGETAQAELVGRDSGYDLAVVKVKGVRGLSPLPLGNSDNVQVGDPVVAIGAPFDLAGTVTSGIISAKQRPITAGGDKGDGSDVSYVDALQTDAPINPGNSGGPLLDSQARVIGINSAIRSADRGSDSEGGQSGSIGLGFAIPINQGKRVAEELINTGKATHPVIGITLDMDYTGDGARVATEGSEGGPPVTRGGPGAKAGIKAGDVITRVDGQRVHSGEELIVKTRAHRPGDRLELVLERGGKERTVSLVLGSSGG